MMQTEHALYSTEKETLRPPGRIPELAMERQTEVLYVADPFWPMLLIMSALLVWFAGSAYQHWTESQLIALAKSSLDVPEQQATKLRLSIDAVAAATGRLAEGGNANAKSIVESLRKRGITINTSAPTASK